MTFSDAADEVLIYGLDDWVPLGTVAWLLRHFGHVPSADVQPEKVIALLSDLLQRGMVQVGEIGPEGYEAWEDDEALEKVKRVMAEYPEIDWYQMCWLSNTELGNEYANSLPWRPDPADLEGY